MNDGYIAIAAGIAAITTAVCIVVFSPYRTYPITEAEYKAIEEAVKAQKQAVPPADSCTREVLRLRKDLGY